MTKQVVKKVDATKASSPKVAAVAKSSKQDKVAIPQSQKTHRFLEASCDCV